MDHPLFCAVWDVGHAHMDGIDHYTEVMDMGKNLKALHIHDNDKLHDSHQVPFSMNIDFVAIVDALKEIGYDGYLTLEASRYLNDFEEKDILYGVKKLYNAVEKLRCMFECK